MGYIQDGTIGYMCQTNRRMRQICKNEKMWEMLCTQAGYVNKPDLRDWMYHYARHATPAYAKKIDDKFLSTMRKYEQLTPDDNDSDVMEIFESMMVHGADAGMKGSRFLFVAIRNAQKEMIDGLLGGGADVHVNGDMAIVYASQIGNQEVVALLIRHGANVTVFNNIALRDASKKGHGGVVLELIVAGANVNANDNEALITAAQNAGCMEDPNGIVWALIKGGANVNARDGLALTYAMYNSAATMVRIIIEGGVKVSTHEDAMTYVNSHNDDVAEVLRAALQAEAVSSDPIPLV
jgi:ankyrin repeat protein